MSFLRREELRRRCCQPLPSDEERTLDEYLSTPGPEERVAEARLSYLVQGVPGHIEEALRELVFEGGELTKRLLGASRAF